MSVDISVIIPVYHPKKEYIDRLMDSLVRQTIGFDRMEILMVVDGDHSTETKEMLTAWEKRFPDQIMLIFYEENKKPGYARTLGMSHASGEYIAFADQDDWLSLEMYQTLYETASGTGCEVAGSRFMRDTEYHKPQIRKDRTCREARVLEIESISDRKKFLIGGLFSGYWTAVYRRDFLEKNKIYFPEGITWDDNFFGTLVSFSVKKYAVVDQAFYHWYNNTESITTGRNGTSYLDRLRIEMKTVEELQARGLFSVYYDEIECLFFGRFYLNTMHLIFHTLDEVPYQVYLYMSKTMRTLFPDYRNNSYITETEHHWCTLGVYPLLYSYYQDLGDKKIMYFFEQVPESLHKTSWLDVIDHPLSEEQLVWWKMLYLMLPEQTAQTQTLRYAHSLSKAEPLKTAQQRGKE